MAVGKYKIITIVLGQVVAQQRNGTFLFQLVWVKPLWQPWKPIVAVSQIGRRIGTGFSDTLLVFPAFLLKKLPGVLKPRALDVFKFGAMSV